MTFRDLLSRYRAEAVLERDKGDRFERLMRAFLLTSPLYDCLRDVWLWKDFPHRGAAFANQDLGIDLVAETNDGAFWAIQCKCYAEDAAIDKPAVDSFLATSGKTFTAHGRETRFAHRLWISTTNSWNANAEKTILHQEPPLTRLGLAQLEAADVDWAALEAGVLGDAARAPRKRLREHRSAPWRPSTRISPPAGRAAASSWPAAPGKPSPP